MSVPFPDGFVNLLAPDASTRQTSGIEYAALRAVAVGFGLWSLL